MRYRPFGFILAFCVLSSSEAHAETHMTAAPATQAFSIIIEGHGPDIILIPGLASSRSVWRDLATRLKAHYRLHLVQLAGFAGEPTQKDASDQVMIPVASALSRYIATRHLQAPTVIGHSLGGALALMVASEHPDQIGKVVIVDALPFYPLIYNPLATRETMLPQAEAYKRAIVQEQPESQREAIEKQTIARLVKTEAARPALVEAGLKSDKKTVANALYDDMTTDLRPALSKITAPVSVIYAYDSSYGIPSSMVDTLYRTAYGTTPHVHFERIDGSYHFVMIDQPEKFGHAVEAALQATP
ncbi:alpha/beta fold hydrolase [Asaia prunellae]|uniref:alpha/beta fold hydrolase n=1 Tax=Asaia prunellae TaxID=610245 RepID=UPI0004712A96|nr:alpha/beta hydrolase [Asaia prunellae]